MNASSAKINQFDLWAVRLDEIGGFTDATEKNEANFDRARARFALRRVLALRLGTAAEKIEVQTAKGGKPFVRDCPFSLSHSGRWLVIATGATEVGVDIETKRPRTPPRELATRFYHPGDAALIADNGEQRFIRQWVAKEAALKAAGVGLAGYLHRARCRMDGEAVCAVGWDDELYAIREFTLPDGTPGALACRGPEIPAFAWRDPAGAGLS